MNEDKLLTTLEALKNEFTGYEEHERKRAMQAQKRNDEYDCQFHTIYANAYQRQSIQPKRSKHQSKNQ